MIGKLYLLNEHTQLHFALFKKCLFLKSNPNFYYDKAGRKTHRNDYI